MKVNGSYEMQIVLLNDEIHFDYIESWGIPITIIKRQGMKKDPRIFWKFFILSKRYKPDIIHTWSIMNTFYALPAKIFLRIPLITSMITTGKRGIRPWTIDMFFFKMSCYFSEYILSNSYAGLKAFKINSPKARVIHNGINPDRFNRDFNKNHIKKDLGVKTPYVVTMVASMLKVKNYDLFLNLAKKASETREDITFIGVGGGSDYERVLHRKNEEDIKNLILTGPSKDVESIISISDIGILFSNVEEGFSNSIMEYMGMRKPVIATKGGGTLELIDDGNSGYLVSNEDFENIYSKILYLIENPEIRKKMGNSGHKAIHEKFTINVMASQFVNLYNSLVKS
jgi:glycosyltransferase involved in cell wall biosynthesis